MRDFCQRTVNGNGCSANQTDIAGRAAGVNSAIVFRAAFDVFCDPHAAADGHGAVHAHAAGANKAGDVIAGDAAAIHGEASLRTIVGSHKYAATGAGDTVAGNAAAIHGETAGVFYPYAATVRVVVSGDAAAVHDEIAALMKIHAVSEILGSTCCCTVGDLAAVLTVGQSKGRAGCANSTNDFERIFVSIDRNAITA